MKHITLIKLGGSIITNKEVPMMVREEVLTRLIDEIARSQKESNTLLIIGHGQGSFAHAPALRYKTMEGFIHKESVIGMAITQDSAAQLNRIVVHECIGQHLPAASFLFSNSMVTSQDVAKHWCSEVLLEYLEKGLLPVTGGDVIVDDKKGCTIWSTEKVLAHVAEDFSHRKDYTVNRIIHVTEVAGMLDGSGSVIPLINRRNQEEVFTHLNGTKGFDVTGGMRHKVEESLDLLDQGIESWILSGLEKDNLYKALVGKKWIGTRVAAEI